MKKYLTILILFLSLSVFAQEETNPFATSENRNTETPANGESKDSEVVVSKGPGGPGEPVPINDYIPLLLLAAVGLIVYQVRKQKQSVN